MTNHEIKMRFFEALEFLKERGDITGIYGFANEHGINASNLFQIRTGDNRWLKPEWIALLDRYGINVEWVLLGRGRMSR